VRFSLSAQGAVDPFNKPNLKWVSTFGVSCMSARKSQILSTGGAPSCDSLRLNLTRFFLSSPRPSPIQIAMEEVDDICLTGILNDALLQRLVISLACGMSARMLLDQSRSTPLGHLSAQIENCKGRRVRTAFCHEELTLGFCRLHGVYA
jgi:hypothetical protein